MNKNRYRIIFNKARGMMMAVAETANSHSSNPSNSKGMQGDGLSDQLATATAGTGAGSSDSAPTAPRGQFQLQALTALLLANTLILPNLAQAQIFAADNVSAQHRPVIGVASNGVPVINVQTPNANGVSRNIYSQMDILSNGVVINNSRTGVSNSVLAGSVAANPMMAAREASVIVNEVRSTAPTRFEGNLEIAGGKADVIIANPSGINVKGAGFINANRATLTTGTPTFNTAGDLTGFSVKKGVVQIEKGANGKGLGGVNNHAQYTDILARAAYINADVHGHHGLNVVTGSNNISANLESITTQSGDNTVPPPETRLDVTQLGGMYARNIYLIGTERGLGVRNNGMISAGHNLVVTSEGRIDNYGTMRTHAGTDSGPGVLSITANRQNHSEGDIRNYGMIEARNLIMLDAGRDVWVREGTIRHISDNENSAPIIINAERNIYVDTNANITTQGPATSLSLSSGSSVIVQTATIDSKSGDLYIDSGDDIQLRNENSQIKALNDITLLANQSISSSAASIKSTQGTIHLESAKPLSLAATADGTAPAAVNHITITGGNLTAAKEIKIVADNNITLNPTSMTAASLTVGAGDNLTYSPSAGRQFIETTGDIMLNAGQQLTISGDGLVEVDRELKSISGGMILTGGTVEIKDVSLDAYEGIEITSMQGNANLSNTDLQSTRFEGDIKIASLNGNITTEGLSAHAERGILSILAKDNVNILSQKDTVTELSFSQLQAGEVIKAVAVTKTQLYGRNGVRLGSIGSGDLNLQSLDINSRLDIDLMAGGHIVNSLESEQEWIGTEIDGVDFILPFLIPAPVKNTFRGSNISIQAGEELSLDFVEILADFGTINQHDLNIHAGNELKLNYAKLRSSGNMIIASRDKNLTLHQIDAISDQSLAISSGSQLHMNTSRDVKKDAAGNPILDNGDLQYFTNWDYDASNTLKAEGVLSIYSRLSQYHQNTNYQGGALNIETGSSLWLKGGVNWRAVGSDLIRNDDSLLTTEQGEPEKRVRDLDGDLSIETRGSLTLTPDMQFTAAGDIDIRARDQLRMTGIAGTNGNASAQRVSLEAGKSITLTAGDMLLEAPRIIAKGGNLNLISTGSTANTRNSIIVNPIRNTFVNYLAPEKVTYLERGIQELNADINAITSTQAYASYQSRLHTLYSLDTPSDRTTRIKEQTINQLHDEFAYLRIPLENLNQEKTVLQHSIEMVKGAATKGWEHLGAELTGEVVNLKSAGGIQLTSANIRGNDFVNIEAAGLLPAETLQVQQFDANNNPVLDANGKPVFFEKQVERASIIIDGTSDYFEYGTQGSNNYGFAAYQNPSEITARNNINVKTGGLTWDHRLVINGANLVTDMNLVDSDNFDLFDIHSGEEYEYIRTGDINLQSFGDISLEATQEELFRFSSNSYKTGKWYKRKYVTETRTNNAVTAYGTSLVANNINLYAGRNIDAYASEFSARGDIAFRATGHRDDPTSGQLNLYAYDEKISSQYTSHQKSKFLGLTYKDTKFNSSRVLHTQLPVSSSSKRFEASTGGSITLVGTQFETRAGVRLHAGTGPQAQANAQIVLKGIVETVTEEKRRESNSVVWQKMEGKGSTTQTLDLPKFTGPVAPELIAPSISIDVANNPDGLDAEIDKLLKNPAYSYLKDIRVREGVNWNQIELELDKWEYEQEGLTPAGAALVAIAVAIASGGTGIGAATTIGGKMGAAAMTALQSQAAITLVNNKGDIGKTLKDLESSDTIKQMATAALTAGLLDVVAGSLNLPLKPEGYLENMYVSTVNSIGSALVSTAVNGGSLSENLEQGLIAGLANGLHAGLAGDIKGLENQYVLHKIMHAAAGCLAASAQRQACEAGAIGAAVGEIVAEMMPAPNPNLSQAEFEAAQTKIREASKLIAGTVAAYTGHDVNTAANIADTAIKNNRQLHEREISLLKQEAKKLAGQQGWSEQDWYNALYSVAFAQVDTKGNQTLQVAIDQLGQATALNENTLLGQNKFESISQNLKIAEGVINTLASQNQTIYYADGQTVVKDASGGIVRAFQATPTQLVNNSLFGQNPLLSNGSVQYRIDPIQLSLNRSALGNIASQKDIVDFFKNQFSAVATAGSGRVDAVYPEFELWGMLGLARGTAAGVTRTIQEMRNNALLNRIEGLGFRANLNAHLPNFDGFSKVGVSGAHNLKVFEDLSKTEGVIINSRTKISEGIWRYEYQIPAMDPRKPGTITHYKSQQTKTVYDPNVYSDAKILSMAQRAAQQNFQTNKQVYINSLNGGPIKNQYSNNIEGVNFQVYLGRDTHGNVYVTNVHPK